MDRKAYNECMRPYITGSKPKEQRKLDFCVGAKLCSQKASSREEAERICSLPKEPKAPKNTGNPSKKGNPGNNQREIAKLAHCMVDKINIATVTDIKSLEMALIDAMGRCK